MSRERQVRSGGEKESEREREGGGWKRMRMDEWNLDCKGGGEGLSFFPCDERRENPSSSSHYFITDPFLHSSCFLNFILQWQTGWQASDTVTMNGKRREREREREREARSSMKFFKCKLHPKFKWLRHQLLYSTQLNYLDFLCVFHFTPSLITLPRSFCFPREQVKWFRLLPPPLLLTLGPLLHVTLNSQHSMPPVHFHCNFARKICNAFTHRQSSCSCVVSCSFM